MLQYKPWEKGEVNSLISESDKKLPVLDIQLGGACNLNCIYCDTPKYEQPCDVNLSAIGDLINSEAIRWVYVCGLGEPTAPKNVGHLKHILQLCKEKEIGLSMFSNVLNIDKELLDYIDNGTLNVLFKLDTFDKQKITHLYGRDVGDKLLRNYDSLKEVTHVENGATNLGASIVPTSVNYNELPSIINYCKENDIFPLIGQLEDAGSGSNVFEDLKVSEEDLIKFRGYLSDTHGIDYEMPICPANISGIHITNKNDVILDERTGLSCPWFWLDEPKIKVVGNIEQMKYGEVVDNILAYRSARLPEVENMKQHVELYPFGGCGGNAKQLLDVYTNLSQNRG